MANTYVTISHDPFARTSVVRRMSYHYLGCDNCGEQPIAHNLFQYGYQSDGSLSGRVNWSYNSFCSIQCWRDYTS